jgi:hypothetical protein
VHIPPPATRPNQPSMVLTPQRRACCLPSVSDLRIQAVDGETMLEDWRHVHNVIIPADPFLAGARGFTTR